MILFSNYDLDFDGTRQFLFDEYADENGWKTVDDVPGEEVYSQAYDESENDWFDFKSEFEKFINQDYWLVMGSVGLWSGRRAAGKIISSFDELADVWRDCDYIKFTDEGGHLYLRCSHHDGTNVFEIKRLNQRGYEYTESHWRDSECDIHTKLFNSNFFTSLPHAAMKMYGYEEKSGKTA